MAISWSMCSPQMKSSSRRACRIIAEIARISEQQAAEVLQQSNNEVKTAIVVSVRKVSPAEARELLAKAAGRLRAVIG